MKGTIKSEFAVVWISDEPKKIRVEDTEGLESWFHHGKWDGVRWVDPIGRSYLQWRKMTPTQRAQMMTETALDLALQGHDLKNIVREFAKVDCFYALGRVSCPMCRLLTSALLGQCLEPNTMSFDELMAAYAPKELVDG